ncbi:YggS family pyridoxal phosphate enzyme [Deinococcus aquiradiocola]|uniref:YggS family pyridoxal phosphate enzyme n=1 Tax=Deinococcus aquiradiocola TaxID=393059 RepID=UPI00166A7B9A|nr:YggS family pyridoxal phosphate enzyme [Deinococcus aquiradiocola]
MSLQDVLREIRAAEVDAGRAPGSARLVAVSKGHTLDEIRASVLTHAALQAGGFPLAENRGQELRDKVAVTQGGVTQGAGAQAWPPLEWHFIGPVQRNKVKYLRAVTLVHTIETAEQAQAIAAAAEGWGRAPDVLLQVHNGEAQKHGVSTEDLPALLREVRGTGLTVRGLMVMAPYDDPQGAERVFAQTALHAQTLGLPELSMGMSDDFPAAIRHGATLVRVGRRLFTPASGVDRAGAQDAGRAGNGGAPDLS